MHRSSILARLITILIALIVTPIAMGILSAGGITWLFAYSSYRLEFNIEMFAGPALMQILAVLLLIGVIATGLWSSAGLIAVGALGLLHVFFAIAPGSLLEVYGFMVGTVPREWLDGLVYGVSLVVYLTLGTMGFVLATVRRRPATTGTGGGIAGMIATPVLLLLGGLLLLWGLGRGQIVAFQTFRFDIDPLAALTVLIGTVFVAAGIGLTRWSPYALVIPAVVLLLLTVMIMIPGSLQPLLRRVPMEVSHSMPTFFLMGGGGALALAYLAFTTVLRRVRTRSNAMRQGPYLPPGGAYPGPGVYPGAMQYPPAAYPPAQYPAAQYPPAAYPPAAQSPPAQ